MPPTVFKNISAKEAVFSETISVVPDLRNNPSILVPPVSYQPTTHVTNSNTKTPLCHPILNIFSKLRFEIACFSFTVALLISQSSSTSMILEKTCLSKYSEDICGNLKNYTEIKSSVEQAAVNYQLIHTLIQTVPAVIVSLFIGSWSDKYGRKLPLQVALLGAIIEAVLSCICAYYRHSKVEYYFIPAIFMGCMGGGAALLTIVYSYTSESVRHEKRTMKNAFFEIAIGLAKPVGVMAGGWIYNFWGYVAVFAIAACGLFFSLLWFTFMIPETRGLDNTDPWTVKAKQFVSCRNVTESFTLKVKQESQSRKKIVLLIISICILHISSSANVLGLVQGCGPIAGRSCLSKSVANEDLGKVFSLVAITESILPIVTLIIFSQIFNAFLDIFPGTPYILLAAVIIVPFSVFIWLSRKSKENYEDIPGKNEWNTKNIPTISKM
ncbi:proton-coupled folate transporter-like isoform X2 [Argiope bruennichi]|uniref:proton-coupled folate transporter-like isoform X2 n=1 Tax=Argiope bruennichi TaxID=94029 RepID=UPI0024950CB3|nr:proton-coupled folate transporter-like isoform X2 [Argiope bruennichi]